MRKLESPFAAMMLVPADPGQTIEKADRLLLCIAAREANTGMKWDSARKSVGRRNFGGAAAADRGRACHPARQIRQTAERYAVAPEGKRGEKMEATSDAQGTTVQLGAAAGSSGMSWILTEPGVS